MSILTKTASVLDYVGIEDDLVGFTNDDTIGLALTPEKWADLGEPEEITVTIEPGATL